MGIIINRINHIYDIKALVTLRYRRKVTKIADIITEALLVGSIWTDQ